MDASVASLMENKAGIDGQSIAGRWVVDCVKERKWAVTATLVNGLCFLGRGRNFAESYGLSVMRDPESTGIGFDFNLEPSKEDCVRYVE